LKGSIPIAQTLFLLRRSLLRYAPSTFHIEILGYKLTSRQDPGVGQIAQEFYELEDEVVKGSSGGEVNVNGADIETFRHLIPANVAMGVDSCLAKCGIAKR
jgi:hypothetical protein